METSNKISISVETIIHAPIEKIWECWNQPEHIMHWYHASDDWHAPYADNDLRIGGKFKTTMAAKDGSFSFDFEGIYSAVKELAQIDYTLLDNRKVTIAFTREGNAVKIIETFEAEHTNSIELQKTGWQNILDNFKKYVESNQ